MISIKVKKVKRKCEKCDRKKCSQCLQVTDKTIEIIKGYREISNYGSINCAHCGSTDLEKWGTYKRSVIYRDANGNIIIEELVVQRVRCKHCGHTHALLPVGLIPYKQISEELMIDILESIENGLTVEKASEEYNFGIETIKRWKRQYKNTHKSRLITCFQKEVKDIFKFLNQVDKQVEYYVRNRMLFMQIRMLEISIGNNTL